jgi:tetratricopeptide (TPR) repeat protein
MHQRISMVLLPAAIATVAAVSPASARDACIPPKVSESLTSCAGIAPAAAAPRRASGGVVVRSIAPPKQTAPGVPNPTAVSVAEIRRGLAGVRRVQLLITEIQGLETLLSATPAGAPDRPGLIRRLADGYVELEASASRSKLEGRASADEIRRKDPARAAALVAEAAKSEKVESAARQAAIKYYGELASKHPRWCQSVTPGKISGCVDETLYNLAYEHEQAGELDKARKTYLELINVAPQSRYIPNAYLAFGELFFQEAQGDPSKWGLAEQSYREVVKYPAPDNKVAGYAHYKLGYLYWNKGDLAQSVSEFKKTIEHGTQFSALPGAKQLAHAARRDIVPVYALAGDPRKAHDFFKPLSGDASGESGRTMKMMADLGQSYLDTGHYPDAIQLYRDLLKRDPGPRSCVYQARVTEATLVVRSGDKVASKAELDRQLDAERRFRGEGHGDEDKRACANTTASLVVETAMAWHLEAVGSAGVRGTAHPQTMAFAADLYDRVVKQFTAEQFASFEFPRIVKEDWPTLLKIKYARADLYYFQKDWKRAGPAFDAVVAEQPNGPLAAESAYASLLSYQNAYLAAHAGHSDRIGVGTRGTAEALAPREISEEQKAMLASFDRYLCMIKPAAGDREAYEKYVEVEYARARIYFEARDWPRAAAAFRAIALKHADTDSGIYAGQLYLEALNVMGTRGTPACFDDMREDVPRLFELYCKGDKARTGGEQCVTLFQIKMDLDRLDAQDKVSAGRFEAGANAYLKIWTEHGQPACEAKQPLCRKMDEVLYNAARAFQAARLLAKSISVRKMLIDPRNNLDKTELARKAVFEIGQNFQAIAVYDEAASWYERFARDSQELAKAPDALQDAIVLRLGLGQQEQAVRDAELFDKVWGHKQPALAAKIAFALGAHDVEHDDLESGRRRLTKAMGDIDRSATIDVQIEAHALLGRVLARSGGVTGAAQEYARVRELFKDPQRVIAKMNPEGGDEATNARRLAKVLTAVGEAIFFSAEQKRRLAEAIRFPEYKGSGKREDVLHHINTKVGDWMKKKRPAIEEAEREYLKVLAIQPAPPPKWVIASGARVGHLWGKFVAEFRAAPIPKEWQQSGMSPFGTTWEEIRLTYVGGLDDASEPDRQRAKGAFRACLDYSVRYQFFDDQARSCERWLSKNYATEYHAVDELRASPSWIGVRVEGQPATLSH